MCILAVYKRRLRVIVFRSPVMFSCKFLSPHAPRCQPRYVVGMHKIFAFRQEGDVTSDIAYAVGHDVRDHGNFLRGIMKAPDVFTYVVGMCERDEGLQNPVGPLPANAGAADRIRYEMKYVRWFMIQSVLGNYRPEFGGLLQENPAILCRVLAAVGFPLDVVDKVALCAEFTALKYGSCYEHIMDATRLRSIDDHTGSNRETVHNKLIDEVYSAVSTRLHTLYQDTRSSATMCFHILEWLKTECGYHPIDGRREAIDTSIERWPRLFAIETDIRPLPFTTYVFTFPLLGCNPSHMAPLLCFGLNPVSREDADDVGRNPGASSAAGRSTRAPSPPAGGRLVHGASYPRYRLPTGLRAGSANAQSVSPTPPAGPRTSNPRPGLLNATLPAGGRLTAERSTTAPRPPAGPRTSNPRPGLLNATLPAGGRLTAGRSSDPGTYVGGSTMVTGVRDVLHMARSPSRR